ncbi:MAG: hypothetical protein K2K76_05685 [Muribaculaceae bacterium]|nr:hypothetical protein [Muribaculaceae bacterium]
MKVLRVLMIAVVTMVSFTASAQSKALNKLIEKYKNSPEVLYTEKRNPQTKEVLKKEIIASITDEKDVKELTEALQKFINDGDGITDVTRTKTMTEVKAETNDRRYSIMVTKGKDNKVSLIYNERPVSTKNNKAKVITIKDSDD